jgi:hypothetical protein
MAIALGPNPADADRAKWAGFLSKYGLSADYQGIGVNPEQIAPETKQRLQDQGVPLGDYMAQLSQGLVGKQFSHANYGHVYDAIPGWQAHFAGGGKRYDPMKPSSPLSDTARANLARLIASTGHPVNDGGGGGSRGGTRVRSARPAKNPAAYCRHDR